MSWLFTLALHALGRHSGLMVSVLVPGVSSPGSNPGWGLCVVFLGKTLSQCLSPPGSINYVLLTFQVPILIALFPRRVFSLVASRFIWLSPQSVIFFFVMVLLSQELR